MRHWEIHGSLPARDKGRPGYPQDWRENVVCHVIAETIEDAIAAMHEKHAGVTIWTAKHLGKVDVIYASKVRP